MGYIPIMHVAHESGLAGFDLNLLLVLDALLAERHVTRAAARLGLTQSAASHALSRLRALLGDPLLVRGPGGAMVPTPRAEALQPALRQALAHLDRALRGTPAFEPATARRTFRVATTDYGELVLLPPLIAALTREAPEVDLWAVQIPTDPADALAAGTVDCAIGVWRDRPWPAGIYQKKLFDERFTCVVRRGHPAAKQRLTLARYVSLPHVLIAPGGRPGSFVDEALADLGKTRRVAVTVAHFLVAPHVVTASDMIVTIPARVARALAKPLRLALLEAPLELPGFTMSMVWHERAHQDPAQRFLREQLTRVSQALA